MEIKKIECPTEITLSQYIDHDIDIQRIVDIEIHISKCDECLKKVRRLTEYHESLKALKAKSEFFECYKNSNEDILSMPAASSANNNSVAIATTKDGKYTIKVVPFLHENSFMIEVQVLDKNLHGTLIIENEDGVIIKAPIVNGFAREEIHNRIDLKDVSIRVEVEK
ncbi:hypothetical protein [Pseudobacteroides cellulosolvens]|uniref:Zinc-finger domain-containing protein n=1 Tax=Pseudobacteroides cellulosolvens ATCC 35603 = DSM 2933 TaxID=398512 RepID=A0A0L6JR84_9FIRM|nr:hypothetical protein [Pseudobacteroides cellulosolvens]KNY27897.1 hypothetical protein Bccel_3168 [Pseudobacteroides cellulosolvens ATCC 35603 = DSM 2933]